MEQVNKIEQRPGCVAAALHILGDKWTPLLLKELVTREATFGELEVALITISPRTLSQRLEKLVNEEVLEKKLYCERPPRYKYRITEKGAELEEILRAMASWGEKYQNGNS